MIIWRIWHIDALTVPFLNQYTHVITFLLLHRDAASGSPTLLGFVENLRVRQCSQNQNGWRQRPWESAARGPLHTTWSVFLTITDPSSQSRGIRGEESHRLCRHRLCPGPCLLGRSHSHRLWRARSHCAKFRPRWNQRLQRPSPTTGLDLWYQCSARPRRNGNCFCRHFDSKTNPSCLKTHLGERVRSEDGDPNFSRSSRMMKRCQHPHIAKSVFGIWSAVSGIYHGVAGKNLGATNGGATHWQRRRPFSLQECGSCSAIFTLGEYRTSWHKAAHFLPRSQQFVGN